MLFGYRHLLYVHIKTDNIYKDIGENVETVFNTTNYELDWPKGKFKKVIELMKDELGVKIMIKCVLLKAKTYSYLIDDGSKDKKEKGKKRCVIKIKIKTKNYKNCLEASNPENKINYLEKNEGNKDSIKKGHKEFIKNNKLLLKTQQGFKSEGYNVLTEKINKIALSSNDDKRMQSIDSIETYA